MFSKFCKKYIKDYFLLVDSMAHSGWCVFGLLCNQNCHTKVSQILHKDLETKFLTQFCIFSCQLALFQYFVFEHTGLTIFLWGLFGRVFINTIIFNVMPLSHIPRFATWNIGLRYITKIFTDITKFVNICNYWWMEEEFEDIFTGESTNLHTKS